MSHVSKLLTKGMPTTGNMDCEPPIKTQSEKPKIQATPKVSTVMLTGGPCGGKSTAMQILTKKFAEIGYKVFSMPEIATMTVGSGCLFYTFNSHTERSEFTKAINNAQIDFEKYYKKLAEIQCQSKKDNVIIICDRGVLDNRLYMPIETKNEIALSTGCDDHKLMEKRYDAIFNMVTAADGSDEMYSNSNNIARTEDPDESIAIDKRLQNTYQNQEHFYIIDNKSVGDFEQKVNKLYKGICYVLKISSEIKNQPMLQKKKYLIDQEDCGPEFQKALAVKGHEEDYKGFVEYIDHIDFLTEGESSEGSECLVRRIQKINGVDKMAYIHIKKCVIQQEQKLSVQDDEFEYEDKMIIDEATWRNLQDGRRDSILVTHEKKVIKFLWDNKICYVEEFMVNGSSVRILVLPEDADSTQMKRFVGSATRAGMTESMMYWTPAF